MRDTIEAVNSGEMTLKDAKENFSIFVGSNQLSKEALLSADVVLKARTKADFCYCLDAFLVKNDKVAEEGEQPVTELERITAEINQTIAQQAKGYFGIGSLLIEAKEQFDKSQDFLKWAEESFGFKKAYVYRLMQVSQQFKAEVWHKTPLRNLFTLAQQGTADDIENARLFIEKGGELSLANLAVILDGQARTAPAPAKTQVAKGVEQELQQASQEVSAAVIADAQQDNTPKLPQAKGVVESSQKAPEGPGQEETEALLEHNKKLMEQIAELTKQLAEATKPKIRDVTAIPTLRQFNSSCMRTRLGLSEEESQDKEIILEAFKEFCRAGYDRRHEAFKLIDEARHDLIHAIKAAA